MASFTRIDDCQALSTEANGGTSRRLDHFQPAIIWAPWNHPSAHGGDRMLGVIALHAACPGYPAHM
jgi:hypothetical protein